MGRGVDDDQDRALVICDRGVKRETLRGIMHTLSRVADLL
jgi:hypothetical protein